MLQYSISTPMRFLYDAINAIVVTSLLPYNWAFIKLMQEHNKLVIKLCKWSKWAAAASIYVLYKQKFNNIQLLPLNSKFTFNATVSILPLLKTITDPWPYPGLAYKLMACPAGPIQQNPLIQYVLRTHVHTCLLLSPLIDYHASPFLAM